MLLHHMHSMAWLVQLVQLVRRAQGVLQGRADALCGLPADQEKEEVRWMAEPRLRDVSLTVIRLFTISAIVM